MGAIGRRGFLGWAAAVGAVAGTGGTAAASMATDAAPRTVLASARSAAGLTIEGDRFLLDGKPFQVISGAIHYFRIRPEQWEDRLNRLRLMGLNTVETYVAWNMHEPRKGKFDFSGQADLARFIETAGRLGLKVVLRPGPYICAEWDFGGLPPWLLAEPEIELRCADPVYERHVKEFFDALLPRIAGLQATRGGPIIAVQVENEYGSYGDDQTHLAHIRSMLEHGGIDSLLFCCNGSSDYMLRGGSLPGTFNTVNFDGGEDPDANFTKLRKIQPHGPLWCTEFWDGWFDHWGEKHHRTDPAEHAANIEKILAKGASINLYMAAGSTNFGWGAGANHDGTTYQPTVTSYDYDSPVSESGELTEKFHVFRAAIGKHAPVPDEPLPPTPKRMAPQTVRPAESAGLLDSLGALSTPKTGPSPLTMEKLGQANGLVHYRTKIQGPQEKSPITISGLADRALLWLDGKPLGTLDRNKPEQSVETAIAGPSSTLDILVDTGGRINFTDKLADPKGITDRVKLAGQTLFGWEMRPLPLDDLAGLRFRRGGTDAAGPVFHRAHARVGSPADGFIGLPGWTKGLVWLNGFLLGRYWNVGPQQTLYAPAPLWRSGRNELIVLELHEAGTTIELRDTPDLGPVSG
ncbi:glycoside hydrolase family 35 protein [Sciscionella sediminilitoris]|uniref:glycoside hydrolase family 35 protein n=1 Tax=Sciscionella sediminilitoris TaxID=1445613 RepID=UPI0004DF3398|nr:beta-galactosidase family protein [Sciscionella sp. SE31]